MRGQGQPSVRGGRATELFFPGGLRGLGGDFLAGHARLELQQGELRVGKLFSLGAILGAEQEADALFQQLDLDLQPAVFELGFLAKFFALNAGFVTLANEALEHLPEGLCQRVEIECDGHFNCPKVCRNPW